METALIIAVVFWFVIAFLVADMGKEREIGYNGVLWISLLLSPIIGVLVALVSPKINNANTGSTSNSVGGDRYKVSLDEAKKAAFKGEIEKSISLYQDTLYYLDNDYKNMNNKAEQSRQALINDIKIKIEELNNVKTK